MNEYIISWGGTQEVPEFIIKIWASTPQDALYIANTLFTIRGECVCEW